MEPKISDIVSEFEQKFGFIKKLSIDNEVEYEKAKSYYVFKVLARHYLSSSVLKILTWLKEDTYP